MPWRIRLSGHTIACTLMDGIRLSPQDNVAVLVRDVAGGSDVRIEGRVIAVDRDVGMGHKVALRPIARGEKIVKYGMPIGSATAAIAVGEHVHVHNMQSDYLPTHLPDEGRDSAGAP